METTETWDALVMAPDGPIEREEFEARHRELRDELLRQTRLWQIIAIGLANLIVGVIVGYLIHMAH